MLHQHTPVVLCIFNRPECTKRVLDVIASVKPRTLFVVADGPRADRPEDKRLVAETRAVIDRVDWPAEVVTSYSDVNLGCTNRIVSGLNWVFEQTEQAVILEDDCLPHPTFFRYCEELLERYEHHPNVHMISGSNVVGQRGPFSYHFSLCYSIWGWATWARAWRHYTEDMSAWAELRDTVWLNELLRDSRGVRIAKMLCDAAAAGRMRAAGEASGPWDFCWVFSGWIRRGLSITPSLNLVENIGFNEQATHERDTRHPLANRSAHAMSFPLKHPPRVEVLREADAAVWSALYPHHFPSPGQRPWRRGFRRLGRALESLR
jgi:hypothetical protein